jgi:hypothetical protein
MQGFRLKTTVVTPATVIDLTDLETVWANLGLSAGPADEYLAQQITSASKYVSSQCNRSFAVETVKDEFWPRWINGCSVQYGIEELCLSRWPVLDDPAIVVIENGTTLVEDTDYSVDYTNGRLTRFSAGLQVYWSYTPLSIQYASGFADLPADIVEAVLRIVRERYFAWKRDPMLRGESIPGVYDAQYWVRDTGAEGNATPDVSDLIDFYKLPVAA